MRQIGNLPNQSDAERLVDYLLTQGVSARCESAADSHTIWVYEENDVDRARTACNEFKANPADPRFAAATGEARKLRQQKADQSRKAQRNVVDLSQRWRGSGSQREPVTWALVIASVAVSIGSSFGALDNQLSPWVFITNGRPLLSLLEAGQLWRLVTPIFVHFSLVHLLLDMYWLLILGATIEARRGPWRMAGLVLISAIASNLAQYEDSGLRFGGMSGVNYALLGYAWMKSRFQPQYGIYVPPNIVVLMIAWLVICMTGTVGDIANTAHLIGLFVGVVIGYLPVVLRR